MSADLEPLLKRLHLANARRVWRDMCQRAEKEEWSYEPLLLTLFAEELARHYKGAAKKSGETGKLHAGQCEREFA